MVISPRSTNIVPKHFINKKQLKVIYLSSNHITNHKKQYQHNQYLVKIQIIIKDKSKK